VWLHTVDGQVILDGMAGLWNVNVGYGREELAQAAFDQMKKLAFTSNFSGMTNLPQHCSPTNWRALLMKA